MTTNTELGIADMVRHHRRRAGLTQKQLSQLAGVSHATIGRMEAELNQPTIDTLQKVAEVLGVSLEGLAPKRKRNAPGICIWNLETGKLIGILGPDGIVRNHGRILGTRDEILNQVKE